MDTDSTVAHGPEHGLERLIFFSDAVFAIAITLLVIDIRVPHLPAGAPDRAYWLAMLELGPEFGGFFISFFVIGFFWAGHHRTMAAASHFDQRLTMPNLMLLCAVAAMPFFTAFVSGNPGQRVPVFLYCLWMLVTALLNRRLQAVVLKPPVLDPRVAPGRPDQLRQRGTSVILGAATATAASLVFPPIGQVMLLTIPFWRRVLRRLGGRGAQQ